MLTPKMRMYFTPILELPGEPFKATYKGLQIVLAGTCPEGEAFLPGQPIYASYTLTETDIAHIAAEIAKHPQRLANPDMRNEIWPNQSPAKEG